MNDKKAKSPKSIKTLKRFSEASTDILSNKIPRTHSVNKGIEKKSAFPAINNQSSKGSKASKGTNRFQELSKLIVSKVDDIIHKNPNPYSISDSVSQYDRDDDKISTSLEPSDVKPKGNTFLTDIELLKLEKENEAKYNLTDLPELTPGDDFLRKEQMEFREMLNEIESCRKQVKGEFDELEYLIKYVKDTKSNVKKHMTGISNVCSKVGIKSKIQSNNVEDSDSGSDGEQLIYNKEKNINKITNKLYDITSNVIGYHQNFNKGMQKVEKRNKRYADGKVKVNVDDEKEIVKKSEKNKIGKTKSNK